MDAVTQQNAALVEEAAAAAQSLEEQSGELEQVVRVFRLAGGTARAAAPARRAARPRLAAAPRVPRYAAAAATADWDTF
jgi:methyl-accepting chemotaxis protein